jgi:hypothetical protein
MKTLSTCFIGVLAFTGIITNAAAAGVITSVSGAGGGLGSFGVLNNAIVSKQLNLSKTFDHIGPIDLTFTVIHGQGVGGSYTVTETITNHTGLPWSDFHFVISEPPEGSQGMVFTNFQSARLTGFAFDSALSSGPRELNFMGNLASGASATATFSLKVSDPGAGKTLTFTLMQKPSLEATVSPVPEPETYGMLMAGLGIICLVVKRRSSKQSV